MNIKILPIGSYEYHWDLPFETDTIIATCIAKKVSEVIGAEVLPAINYGFSIEHIGKRETVSVDLDVFIAYVREVVFSALRTKPDKFIIINGHGGNYGALEGILRETRLVAEKTDILLVDICKIISSIIKNTFHMEVKTIIHGGPLEASLLAACNIFLPEIYHEASIEEILKNIKDLKTQTGRIVERPWIISDLEKPETKYSIKLGKLLLENMVKKVCEEIMKGRPKMRAL